MDGELIDDNYDKADYRNQGQGLSCSVKHSCTDLCVEYSHVPEGTFANAMTEEQISCVSAYFTHSKLSDTHFF